MIFIFLALAVIILDQGVKWYIQMHMTAGMSIPVIKNIFHITYVLNPGAAFGVLEHKTAFFIAIAVVMIGVVLYFFPRIPKEHKLMRIGTVLMAGGAIGNVIDRCKTGYVVDYLDFRVWPVFNIADMAIVTGVICIIYSTMFLYKEDGAK